MVSTYGRHGQDPALTLAVAPARRWWGHVGLHRPWLHETEFAARASNVSLARAFVLAHLLEHDLPHLVDDVALVLSELATNAVIHAGTPFTVVLGGLGDRVFLEVADGSQDGPPMPVERSLETGGSGMAIVHALSLAWGVTPQVSGGKSVWAEFDVDGMSVDFSDVT